MEIFPDQCRKHTDYKLIMVLTVDASKSMSYKTKGYALVRILKPCILLTMLVS